MTGPAIVTHKLRKVYQPASRDHSCLPCSWRTQLQMHPCTAQEHMRYTARLDLQQLKNQLSSSHTLCQLVSHDQMSQPGSPCTQLPQHLRTGLLST